MQTQDQGNWNGRIWGGLLLLGIGAVLFLRQFGFPLPYWLFQWPVFLIVVGLFLGLRHGFRRPGWAIMVIIGTIFLFDFIEPAYSLRKYTAPIILVAIGLFMILSPRGRHHWRKHPQRNWGNEPNENKQSFQSGFQVESTPSPDASTQDYIDSVAIFGGVRKVIVSKDFKGGDLVSVLGGNEIDLSKADINGKVVLEVAAILGGIKLILPSHWEVKSEVVALFGSVDDKRQIPAGVTNPGKILLLKGTSIFGGINIRNY